MIDQIDKLFRWLFILVAFIFAPVVLSLVGFIVGLIVQYLFVKGLLLGEKSNA